LSPVGDQHSRTDAPDVPDGPRSVLAVLIALLALSLPGWVVLAHVHAVSTLKGQVPDLSTLGATTTSGRWALWPDRNDSLVTVTVDRAVGEPTISEDGAAAPDGAGSAEPAESVERALTASGFEPVEVPGGFHRPVGSSSARSDGDIIAVVVPTGEATAEIHFGRRPWTPRHAMPAVLYAATLMVTASVLMARSGTSARQLLGAVTLLLVIIQGFLLIRALWTVGHRIDAVVADTGPLTPTRLSAAELEPRLEQLRAEVAALAAPLRGLGASTIWLLLPPWAVGSLATFSPRRAPTGAALALGVVAVVVTALGWRWTGTEIGRLLQQPTL
jgi:hypothetical protein